MMRFTELFGDRKDQVASPNGFMIFVFQDQTSLKHTTLGIIIIEANQLKSLINMLNFKASEWSILYLGLPPMGNLKDESF